MTTISNSSDVRFFMESALKSIIPPFVSGWIVLVETCQSITANLKVTDIEESLLVHPALAEALAEAAE